MNKTIPSIVLAVCLIASLAAAQAAKPTLETLDQKASYLIGRNWVQQAVSQGVEVDEKALIRGIQDTLRGADPLILDADAQQIMGEFQTVMMNRIKAKQEQAKVKNEAAGSAYRASNGERAAVTTLPSGLQYEVLQEGTGAIPESTDKVTVHYKGTLVDGTQFDSSYDRGEPTTFPIGGVISGWTEALQLMKTGSKWKLSIPPDLAYADRAMGDKIGPGSTLIFEIHLLEIVAAQTQ